MLLPLPALIVGGIIVEHSGAVGQMLPKMIFFLKWKCSTLSMGEEEDKFYCIIISMSHLHYTGTRYYMYMIPYRCVEGHYAYYMRPK